jgi:hypothetical protein
MGGNIYENWAAVSRELQELQQQQADPARSTASIFSFRF